MKLKILCIGDVVGRPGRQILAEKIPSFVKSNEIDCVIANCENAAGGSGLTPQIYKKLLKYGINLITLGDHVYRKKEIIPTLESNDNIVRPANLSSSSSGKLVGYYQSSKGHIIAVVSLIGRVFMNPSDCPFSAIDKLLPKIKLKADIIIVDFHAEATSEKIAMGYHLDGRVSCMFGTHTHVATADEQILSNGTAYITDVGMTGPHLSVIGRKVENIVKSFRTQMPLPFEIATGDVQINGLLITVDSNTKKAVSVERIRLVSDLYDDQNYDSDDGRPNKTVPLH